MKKGKSNYNIVLEKSISLEREILALRNDNIPLNGFTKLELSGLVTRAKQAAEIPGLGGEYAKAYGGLMDSACKIYELMSCGR